MTDDEHVPLLSSRHDGPSEKFEKDPEGLDVGIDIKNLVKIYNGETGKGYCYIIITTSNVVITTTIIITILTILIITNTVINIFTILILYP